MARQFGWAAAALVLVTSTAAAAPCDIPEQQKAPSTQPGERHDHDRGPWWKTPATMAEIGITAEQSAQIDKIFRAGIDQMKPLREEVTQLEKGLDKLMQANTADVVVVAQESARIEAKRAELNKMRTVMLYRIRRVLNADQNARFQAYMDRREAERRKLEGDRRR